MQMVGLPGLEPVAKEVTMMLSAWIKISVTRIHSYPFHAQGSIQGALMRHTSVGKYHIRLLLQL